MDINFRECAIAIVYIRFVCSFRCLFSCSFFLLYFGKNLKSRVFYIRIATSDSISTVFFIQACVTMDIVNLAIILLTILTFVYGYFKYSYGYWKARGVPFDEPSIPYGNLKVNEKICSKSEIIKHLYDKYKATGVKICGFYHFIRPIAIIFDIDLIKRIFINDCNKFVDRNVYFNDVDEPISAHSSFGALNGERWQKLCTTTLVPAFSSEKMKAMFPSMVQVGEQFRDCLIDAIGKQPTADEVEITEWCSRFMTDGIACVFGIECKTLTDENGEFQQTGANGMSEFLAKTVSETIERREAEKIQRDDLMGILLKLKNDEDEETALTLNEIIAQTYALFEAGFSGSATVLTFCLYELAIQFNIQSKARNVINEACSKFNGRFTYEMIVDMPYLDQIIEGKYPHCLLYFCIHLACL